MPPPPNSARAQTGPMAPPSHTPISRELSLLATFTLGSAPVATAAAGVDSSPPRARTGGLSQRSSSDSQPPAFLALRHVRFRRLCDALTEGDLNRAHTLLNQSEDLKLDAVLQQPATAGLNFEIGTTTALESILQEAINIRFRLQVHLALRQKLVAIMRGIEPTQSLDNFRDELITAAQVLDPNINDDDDLFDTVITEAGRDGVSSSSADLGDEQRSAVEREYEAMLQNFANDAVRAAYQDPPGVNVARANADAGVVGNLYDKARIEFKRALAELPFLQAAEEVEGVPTFTINASRFSGSLSQAFSGDTEARLVEVRDRAGGLWHRYEGHGEASLEASDRLDDFQRALTVGGSSGSIAAAEVMAIGITAHARDAGGNLLHRAVLSGSKPAVKYCLTLGVSLHQQNAEGLTPLDLTDAQGGNILHTLMSSGDGAAVVDAAGAGGAPGAGAPPIDLISDEDALTRVAEALANPQVEPYRSPLVMPPPGSASPEPPRSPTGAPSSEPPILLNSTPAAFVSPGPGVAMPMPLPLTSSPAVSTVSRLTLPWRSTPSSQRVLRRGHPRPSRRLQPRGLDMSSAVVDSAAVGAASGGGGAFQPEGVTAQVLLDAQNNAGQQPLDVGLAVRAQVLERKADVESKVKFAVKQLDAVLVYITKQLSKCEEGSEREAALKRKLKTTQIAVEAISNTPANVGRILQGLEENDEIQSKNKWWLTWLKWGWFRSGSEKAVAKARENVGAYTPSSRSVDPQRFPNSIDGLRTVANFNLTWTTRINEMRQWLVTVYSAFSGLLSHVRSVFGNTTPTKNKAIAAKRSVAEAECDFFVKRDPGEVINPLSDQNKATLSQQRRGGFFESATTDSEALEAAARRVLRMGRTGGDS